MPRTDLRLLILWIALFVLILTLAIASRVWARGMGAGGGMGGPMGGGGMEGPMEGSGGPGGGGPGRGSGPGGGPGRQAPPRFDLSKAITITGQVESLGSYGLNSWRSMPGMAVQGITLKTDQGNIEVYLGPPAYVTQQKFILQQGDTLEVKGLKVLHGDKAAFLAAKVKKNKQTLTVLDENGFPLFSKQEKSEKAGPGGNGPGPGGGMMGGGGMGKAR